jgi:hypothetical protein
MSFGLRTARSHVQWGELAIALASGPRASGHPRLFGLVRGFGFSFALRESLQFAGVHLLTSLLSFNVGVELGQLLVVATLIPALNSRSEMSHPSAWARSS